ncbi:hypothetical protein GQ457_01G035390 [Hibiscus cannabinus]
MGCLYSVFDVKKQGKTVWVVRARNWKLRGGENRLSGLLEGVSIASLGEGKEARRIHLDLCSSTVFENYGSMIKQWGGVVYRSWTFGFDSDIPRVTISGRFCDWTGSRGLHLLVSEPGYAIIGTVSERAPVCWAETRQKLSPLVDILKGTTEKVKLICDQLKIASDRQKSYVDLKCREIEYVVGDRVFLKVSPWKKVMRFGRKGKLSPRYIGPYEIVERVGSVAYRLLLPLE